MRIPVTILALVVISAATAQASTRGVSGPVNSGMYFAGGTPMRTGVVPGPMSASGPGKVVHAPVAMKKRMILDIGCYASRYRQLRAAGQDAGLASAGAALI